MSVCGSCWWGRAVVRVLGEDFCIRKLCQAAVSGGVAGNHRIPITGSPCFRVSGISVSDNLRDIGTLTSSIEQETRSDTAQVSGLRRVVYLVLAGLFFALGALGVVLPVLPTTPFLLLCSYFLVRSFPRLNARLLNSRVFGPILQDWQQKGGIRRRVKIRAIVLVLAVMCISLSVASVSHSIRGVVVGLVTIGIVVICRLPEVTDDELVYRSPMDTGVEPAGDRPLRR